MSHGKHSRKQRMTRGVTILTGFTLLLASACSSNSSDQPKSSPGASNQPASETSSPKPSAPKMKLSIFINSTPSSNLPTDPKNDFVRTKIEEKFNVELNTTYMPGGQDYNNKINALIAANNAPDMWRDFNGDGGNSYVLNGVLADMTPFVSKTTMPNYYNHWVTEQGMKLYQIQNEFYRAPIPYQKNLYYAYYIRKDWLDKLGLNVPKSYDEYLNVLRAFRNNDPDGNGKKDTYGFTLAAGGDGVTLSWPEYQKNGLIYPSFQDGDRFVDMQMDLRFEQVANDVVKLIKEDLIDPDWFLSKAPSHIDRAAQGKVGVVQGSGKTFAFDSQPDSLQSKTKLLNPNANWVAFNPFGDKPLAVTNWPGNPFLFPKNAAEKSPEKIKKIVEILDWLAGEEGFLLTHYGVEGKHYTRQGNKISLKPEAYKSDITEKGDFLQIWGFFTPDTPDVYGLEVINPNETEHDRQVLKTVLDIPVLFNVGANVVPPKGFDLGTFRKKARELQTKLILDDKSGAKWPQYREILLTEYKGNELFAEYAKQTGLKY